jgi:asparagine synthase (glutamine-hydrolysing)
MCGIVGALAFDKASFRVGASYINSMRDAMLHRGPDGCGTWISKNGKVGLGHRRLAIVDLSEAASQPMSNEDGTLWLTFNGEIYNHAEVRAELEQLGGHRWKTDHSDSEVILHGFEQWGIDCLSRFRGMFAFALWDARREQLWLVRDRLGIKPLCYSVHHGRITFASEIKALLEDPDQERSLDEESFYHYLSFLTTPAPNTLFRGIRKLPCGTWLRVSANGDIHEQKYWDVLDHTEPLTSVSEEEISERILSTLRTAVSLRKVSDVPVGVFLSGGIDSSTNTQLFSEGEASPVRTFSIGYEGGNYTSYKNELHYARRMASSVGADHNELLLNQAGLLDFLPRMVELQDEPIADPVCFPVYFVSKLARDHGVIVCQVGEGADELFWGYPNWKQRLQLQRLADLPAAPQLSALAALGLKSAGRGRGFRHEMLRRSAEGLPIFWSGSETFTEAHKQLLLSSRLKEQLRGLSSWDAVRPIHERFQQKAWEKSRLAWMSYVDLNFRLPELLLMRVDKMSMGVSLEARVPFLDHKLVELAMSIPESIKTKNGTLKYILKKAVRGVIPDELIDRPKQGFGVPIYEWTADLLGGFAKQNLHEFCEQTDVLDQREVARLFEQHRSKEIWSLLNFALWWKRFIEEPRHSALAIA